MKNWLLKKLGDIAEFTNGGAWSPDEYVDSGIPVVRVSDISDGTINLEQCKYLSPASFNRYKKHMLYAGDLVIATVGSHPTQPGSVVGRPAIVPVNVQGALLNQNAVRIAPGNKLLNKGYLGYLGKSQFFRDYIIKRARGSANQVRMSIALLKEMDIPLPPLPTQKKIASILSAYDDLIENNIRRIQILEEMAQTLYHEWFVKFRFPGHEQTKMVDSELGLIPEGWEVKQLSELCLRITDGSHWSPKSVDDGYPMASVKDMHTWGLTIESCRKISEEDYEKLVHNGCKPFKGDILIAKDGNTYLKHMFVVEKEINLVILSSIAILRPNNNRVLSYVLVFYLLEPSVKSRLKNYVSGAAIPRIILKDFARFPVLVPSLDIQQKFYNLAEAMIKKCHCLINKNVNIRKTRDLLLPKLISGEIDVEHLDINTTEDIAA